MSTAILFCMFICNHRDRRNYFRAFKKKNQIYCSWYYNIYIIPENTGFSQTWYLQPLPWRWLAKPWKGQAQTAIVMNRWSKNQIGTLVSGRRSLLFSYFASSVIWVVRTMGGHPLSTEPIAPAFVTHQLIPCLCSGLEQERTSYILIQMFHTWDSVWSSLLNNGDFWISNRVSWKAETSYHWFLNTGILCMIYVHLFLCIESELFWGMSK